MSTGTLEREDSSICADCRKGDHGNHRRLLGDICIGCACPETPHRGEQ